MERFLFYAFGLGAVLSAIGVVRSRSAVYSVLWLVLAMGFTAGLFALRGAFLVAAVQILVYAGAVLVLFLFVVMLTDLKSGAPESGFGLSPLIGAVLAAALFAETAAVIQSVRIPAAEMAASSPAEIARLLFGRYALPFELTSLLLLAAVVSVVVLARKEPS